MQDGNSKPNGFHLLTEGEAAKALTISKRTLQSYRVLGAGPSYVQLGARRIAYTPEAVRAFAERNTRRSTSDDGKK